MNPPEEAAPSDRWQLRPRTARLVLGLLVGSFFLVGWATSSNHLSQFTGDIGVKLLQIDNLARGHAWLDSPGGELDPRGELFPLRPPFIVTHDDKTYSVYLNPVTYLAAAAYPTLGFRGGRLFVLLCALGSVAAARWLALGAGLAEQRARLAGALTLFATPLWLYGWVFWEHGPATLLCALGTAAVLRESREAFPRWSLTATVALGVGMACRPEVFLFALALALAVLWVDRRPAVAALLVVGTPVAYALTGVSLPGMPFLENAGLILEKVFGLWSGTNGEFSWLDSRTTIVERLLIGALGAESAVSVAARRCALALTVLLLIQGVLGRLGRPLRKLGAVATAITSLLLIAPALSLARNPQTLLDGLLVCCPLALAALPQPAREGEPSPSRGMRIVGITAAAFLCAALLLAQNSGGNQWGPRYLLPAMPLIACLVASRRELTLPWTNADDRLRGATLVTLLIASLCIQGLGMRNHLMNSRAKAAGWERVAAMKADVFLTPVWFLPQEGAGLALREETPFLLAGSQEALADALERLEVARIPAFVFFEIGRPNPGPRRFGRYVETQSTELYLQPFVVRASRFDLSP
ncbi:MAG: hypothetical protein AAF690_28785 [Acidobacteriota bacterium]